MLKRLCMSILLIISCGRVNAMSPLHEAAKEGDLPRVRQLIADGAKINEPGGKRGWSPLHYAAYKGHVAVVEALIAAKADVDRLTLNLAVRNGHQEVSLVLIDAGANIDEEDCRGQTLLHHCVVTEGGIEAVQLLIKLGANVNKRFTNTPFGNTPLHIAAWNHQIKTVRLLIAAGADMTLQNDDHQTALQMCTHPATIELLTDHQQRIQEALQRMPIIASVLAMATHPRLGAGSLTILDQNLLRHISQLATEAELYAARQPR